MPSASSSPSRAKISSHSSRGWATLLWMLRIWYSSGDESNWLSLVTTCPSAGLTIVLQRSPPAPLYSHGIQKPSPASMACSKRVFVAALTSEAALMLPVAGKIFIFTRWASSFTIRIGAFSADIFTVSCLS